MQLTLSLPTIRKNIVFSRESIQLQACTGKQVNYQIHEKFKETMTLPKPSCRCGSNWSNAQSTCVLFCQHIVSPSRLNPGHRKSPHHRCHFPEEDLRTHADVSVGDFNSTIGTATGSVPRLGGFAFHVSVNKHYLMVADCFSCCVHPSSWRPHLTFLLGRLSHHTWLLT